MTYCHHLPVKVDGVFNFVSVVKQVDTTDQLLIREMGEIGGFVRWIGYKEKNPLFCKSCRFESCLRHKYNHK